MIYSAKSKVMLFIGLSLLSGSVLGIIPGCGSALPSPETQQAPPSQPAPPAQPADDFTWYADLYNTLGHTQSLRIRGRLVHEEGPVQPTTTTPMAQLSQDEAKNHPLTLWLNQVQIASLTTDDEGYFNHRADISALSLQAGVYVVEARVDNVVAGVCEATVLAMDHDQAVVRSDVDMTYLNTDFQTWDAMLALMVQDASKRETLPGMAAIYQAMARPTVFLSGSPKFFKRVLDGKMTLDSVDNAGLVLKPYKDLVVMGLWDVDPEWIVPALKEQIGYKLTRLFELRQDLPSGTTEVLMGDDTEADHVIYALYDRFMSDEISHQELMATLESLHVSEPWLGQIAAEASKARAGSKADPVVAIYINQTSTPGEHFAVADWSVEGKTLHHAGSAPLQADLTARGLIAP